MACFGSSILKIAGRLKSVVFYLVLDADSVFSGCTHRKKCFALEKNILREKSIHRLFFLRGVFFFAQMPQTLQTVK